MSGYSSSSNYSERLLYFGVYLEKRAQRKASIFKGLKENELLKLKSELRK